MNKKIKYTTEGTDTELDKSIIENVADPLMHILRNSLDHGIEDSETRKKTGKSEEGSIKLKAFHSGASVHIQVIDDGKGLDKEKIKAKAESNGLIPKGANLSEKEIFDLIFLPGFSTADSVTDVSGRGVGMDVVRKKISEIRGEIDVESEPGKGTTITIKLPLTLSIIDGLLLNINDDRYIIPLTVVNKIFPVKHAEIDRRFYNLVTLDGEQIPFYDLKNEFNYNASEAEHEQVVVVSYEEKKVGLVVDKVLGEYQAVLKPLGKMYKDNDIFSGATILGDGSVALVMDTNKIVKKYSSKTNFKKEA
jgi:two-component system chemotaxis sensor kinase CheA